MNINIKEVNIGSLNSIFKKLPVKYTDQTPDLSANIKHIIKFVDNNIEYKLINKDEDLMYYHVVIPFSLIQEHSSFGAQTLWGFKDSALSEYIINNKANGENIVSENGTLITKDTIISIFDRTLQEKDPVFGSNKYETAVFPLKIFVPYNNSTLNDIILCLTCDVANGSTYELDVPEGSDVQVKPTIKDLIATVDSTATVDESGNINVEITTDPRLNTIYLEPVIGLLNKTRVELTNGSGKFTVIPIGLTTGDKVSVRLGHKKYVAASLFEYTL